MFVQSLKTLLAGIVDYAGLFPPASLTMAEAVRNYAEYLKGEDSWMLGRLILPVARLNEFEREFSPSFLNSAVWKLSVLGRADLKDDLGLISSFNLRYIGQAIIDTIEIKASTIREIQMAADTVPTSFDLFVEIPITSDPGPLVHAIGEAGRYAKVRTGGVTVDAFPKSRDLARFIRHCVQRNVRFKSTAGLHHPLHAAYKLTYNPESETGMMFGYLNVFLAAAFLKNGIGEEEAVKLLEERSPDAFRFAGDGISWGNNHLTIDDLETVRKNVALSFGSCSFREPLDDLRTLKLV